MVETRPKDQLSTDQFQAPDNLHVREGSSEMSLSGLVGLSSGWLKHICATNHQLLHMFASGVSCITFKTRPWSL